MIALRGMLKACDFISDYNFAFGGRTFDYGWEPETFGDYQNWYGSALEIVTRLALSDSPLRVDSRQVIAEVFRSLWRSGQVFDRLETAALAIGNQEHWLEGWLAVRETIKYDGESMGPVLADRLLALADRLAPVGLLQLLRSHVLTPAHRIARLAHRETAEAAGGYVQAHQALIDEVRRIGCEVGAAPSLLDGIWSELFGPDAHQASWFGEGLAEASADVSQAWQGLLGYYAATDEGRRNPSLLAGFLKAVALRDRAKAAGFMDIAVEDPLLAPVFPWLQISAGVDEAGVRRLLDSIKGGLAPPRSYWNLCRIAETIPPADLDRILLGIAGLPDGYPVAAEILSMHFHPRQENPVQWNPALLDCGRKLLGSYPLDQAHQSTDYGLAIIASVCLKGTEAAADAGLICQWIADASTAHRSPSIPLDDLAKTLLILHPQTALDCWLGDTQESSQGLAWHLFGNDDRNPLGKVPIPILLEWAGRDSETRLLRLADVIPVLEKQNGGPAWSEAAMALLNAAPDRAAMLQRLAQHFRPSGWIGSLAVILEERRPLIQPFLTDADPAVIRAASVIDQVLQREIAAEAEREINRDERFE
jgi:hypothetical protein